MVKNIITMYPWLKDFYKEIVSNYIKKYFHHAIIIRAQHGIGINCLIEALICWIMCKKRLDFLFCNNCSNCHMIKNNIHPNCYILKSKKENIGIDTIRLLLDKIKYCNKEDAPKVVWIPNTKFLTAEALNAILKILEEPIKNTWFFFVQYKTYQLPSNLRSRCIQWNVPKPDHRLSLLWLKKLSKKEENICNIALRLSDGSPKIAYELINKKWQIRDTFFNKFSISLKTDILNMLPIFHHDMAVTYIYWLYTFFFDIIILRYKQKKYILNFDKIFLIEQTEKIFSFLDLIDILDNLQLCYFDLNNLSQCNCELILTKYFFNIKNILDRKNFTID